MFRYPLGFNEAQSALPLSRPFPLVRYFALLSLGCMLLVAVPMAYVLHVYSQGAMERIAEERNVGYTNLIKNTVWSAYRPFYDRSSGLNGGDLRAAKETADLNWRVALLAERTGVLKIKIYDLSGRTVFSTDPQQIDAPGSDNEGVTNALKGQVTSELTHRHHFDSFERERVHVDVLATYLPISEEGRVVAVFELYSDVTRFVEQMTGMRNAVAATVGFSIAVLYLLLGALIWRAKRTIDRQQTALAENNRQLEARVAERTQELTHANIQLRDEIAERVRAATDLRLAATVFENTGEGVLIADENQRVLAVNRAFSEITGYSESDIVGQTPRLLNSGRQGPAFYTALWAAINARGSWTGEIWNRRKDGQVYPEWLSIAAVRDEQGELTHYVGVFSDISDIKASQERLEYLAHHDVLTGLPNRVQLGQKLAKSIEEAARSRRRFAVLFIDLDHFKHINDTLGHPFGDRLLAEVGAALRAALVGLEPGGVSEQPMLARVGGDEFVLLLPLGSHRPGAERWAHRILEALSNSFEVDEHELFVGASIGIACFPDDGEQADALLANADAAMYRAKSLGRNAVCTYDPQMTDHARDRLAFGAILRRAVENDQLVLQYQPQIALGSGELVGVEALVRLDHPELGLIGPSRFIELAEEDGTIGRVGAWVLREGIRAMASWRAQGIPIPSIALNVSVSQLEREDLPDQVSTLLKEFDVPAEAIEIEITESVIMHADHALEKLEQLQALGIRLAIDDFGTGYSSLNYLRHLPVQKLKIDRSFVSDLSGGRSDALSVVRSVISLAKSLGLKTVAEGVESDQQLALLRDEGCDVLQGYLVSRPLSNEELASFALGRVEARGVVDECCGAVFNGKKSAVKPG